MNNPMMALRTLLVVLVVCLTTGCASVGKNPQDPFEDYNRTMFDFNDKVDSAILKPVATAYAHVTPGFVQTGVGNFFGNINDVPTALNDFLQARPADGASDLARVVFNSTFGIAGMIDVATPAGLAKHDQDFGQTLGRWGVGSGPYLILPFIGPTTTRDALAMPLDFEMDPWGRLYPVALRNIGSAIRVVDHRAYMLGTSTLIEEAALDRYEFVRDAYLQRRQSKIYKGANKAAPTEEPGNSEDANLN